MLDYAIRWTITFRLRPLTHGCIFAVALPQGTGRGNGKNDPQPRARRSFGARETGGEARASLAHAHGAGLHLGYHRAGAHGGAWIAHAYDMATLNRLHHEGFVASDEAWRHACPPDFRRLAQGALLTGCR